MKVLGRTGQTDVPEFGNSQLFKQINYKYYSTLRFTTQGNVEFVSTYICFDIKREDNEDINSFSMSLKWQLWHWWTSKKNGRRLNGSVVLTSSLSQVIHTSTAFQFGSERIMSLIGGTLKSPIPRSLYETTRPRSLTSATTKSGPYLNVPQCHRRTRLSQGPTPGVLSYSVTWSDPPGSSRYSYVPNFLRTLWLESKMLSLQWVTSLTPSLH